MDYEKIYKENIEYKESANYKLYESALRDYYHSIDETLFEKHKNLKTNTLEIKQKKDNSVVLSIQLPTIVNLYKIRFTEEKNILEKMNIIQDLLYQYKIIGKQPNDDEKQLNEFTQNIKLDYEDYNKINNFFDNAALFLKSLEDERNNYFKEMNFYFKDRKKYFDMIRIGFDNNIKRKLLLLFQAEGVPTKSERYSSLETELGIKKEKIEAYLKWCQSSKLYIENQIKFNNISKKIRKELENQQNIITNFVVKEAKVQRLLDTFDSGQIIKSKSKISSSTKLKLKQNQQQKENKIKKTIKVIIRKKQNKSN